MGSLLSLNRLALSLLCAAYTTSSQQRQEQVCILAAAKGLGIREWEFRRAFQYLLGEGLVERVQGGTHVVKLTCWGLAEASHRSKTGRVATSTNLFHLGDLSYEHARLPEAS